VAADGFSWSCASRRKEQLTALRSARKKKSDSKEMRVSRVVEREEEEEEKEKETG
jgi:hypothetical protein